MNKTVAELLVAAFVVTMIVTMVGFLFWLGDADMAYPEDVKEAVKTCELNDGWKTIELHTPTARTITCNNGGVFVFTRGKS